MTSTYTDQVYTCARHIYDNDGWYILCEARPVECDMFGREIPGGGYRDLGPISFYDALAIRLGPLQGLRHVMGETTLAPRPRAGRNDGRKDEQKH